MNDLVALDLDDGIATVALTDQDRRNALSTDMFDAIEAAITTVEANDTTNVLRLRAEGTAFCAGFDLKAMAEDAMLPDFLHRLGGLCRRLRDLHAVVVMEVQGPAIAGGCALVSAGDIVHAGPDATFGYPVHRLGISPAVSLPTLMGGAGFGAARRLALSGQLVDARTARHLGLVHRLASDRDALSLAVEETCRRLASFDASCVRETKRYLNHLDLTDQEERFDSTLGASVETARLPEADRRLRAALESMRARAGR